MAKDQDKFDRGEIISLIDQFENILNFSTHGEKVR